jgi:hypothetical protein
MPTVDFTNVEEMSFDPLPAGEYLLRVVEAEEREGPTAPYINLRMEVVDGDYAGRSIFEILSLSEKALFRLKGFMLAAGYEDEELAGSIEFDPDDFLEVEVLAQVKQRKDNNGEMRNRVNKFSAA